MVNNEQLTVQFYVDDLKALHKEQSVLNQFLDELRSVFGKEDERAETRELLHEYLGLQMIFEFQAKLPF